MRHLPPVLLLVLLLTAFPFIDPVRASTEQRCYYDADKLAPADILPCYTESDTSKPTWCCKKGSKCMEESTCWDRETGVTYQYGCTDKEYRDGSCPAKCGLDSSKSNWVGLVLCGTGEWICHHPDNCGGPDSCPAHTPWDPLLERPPDVSCDALDTSLKAFDAGSRLQDIMFLPSADRSVETYLADHPVSGMSTMSRTTRRPGSTFDTSTTGTATDTKSRVSGTSSVPLTVTVSGSATQQTSGVAVTPTPSGEVPGPVHSGGSGRKGLTIGLGICIPLVGLGLGGWLVFWWIGKRRKAINRGAPQNPSPDMSEYVGPGDGHFHHPGPAPAAGYPYNADSYGQAAQELPAPISAPPAELEGLRMEERSPMQSIMQSPVSGGVSPLGSDYSRDESQRYSAMSPSPSGCDEARVASGVTHYAEGDQPSGLWGKRGPMLERGRYGEGSELRWTASGQGSSVYELSA